MNRVRQRRLGLLLFIVSVVMVTTFLILYALRQNINLFYTPTQLVNKEAPFNRQIRLGGMVVKKSVLRAKKGLAVTFQLTDFKETITVHYEGILPDLFREGQGIVTLGSLKKRNYFEAKQVLAKHDVNYMPREVKQSLVKQKGNKSDYVS